MISSLSDSLTLSQYESDELEKSVFQDYDSDSDVPEELKQDYVDEQTGDAPLKRFVSGVKGQLALLKWNCWNCTKKSSKTLKKMFPLADGPKTIYNLYPLFSRRFDLKHVLN